MWCHVTKVYISYRIEIPLDFELTKTGTIHGLAFWFEAVFIGTRYVISMVCMSPFMSLLPSCFVQCHSMVVYCSTPANHSLASGTAVWTYFSSASYLAIICDWLWENLQPLYKDKYIELCDWIIQTIILYSR